MVIRLFIRLTFVLILFPLASLSSPIKKLNDLADKEMQHRIENFISKFENHISGFQGGAIAMVQGGNVIYQKSFGFQHDRHGAITENTLFPLASVSKTITATVVALLVKEEKLSLNDNAADILGLKKSRLKIRNILNHTTGYSLASDKDIEKGIPRKTLIKKIQKVVPSYIAGTHFCYSNFMFSCIQEVILDSTYSPWNMHVDQLWHALKVQDYAVCSVPISVELAEPHVCDKNTKKITNCGRMPRYYPQTVCSAAGLFASLKSMIDFLKLQQGYYPNILTKTDFLAFHTPTTEAPDAFKWPIKWPYKKVKSFYGLGWRILEKENDPRQQSRMVFHGGYLRGVGTFVGFIPAHDIGIVVLINQDTAFALQTGVDFWACVVGKSGHNN